MISSSARVMRYSVRSLFVLRLLLLLQRSQHCARCGNSSNEYTAYDWSCHYHYRAFVLLNCSVYASVAIDDTVLYRPGNCRRTNIRSARILFHLGSVYAYSILPDLCNRYWRWIGCINRSRNRRWALRPFLVCLSEWAKRTYRSVTAWFWADWILVRWTRR